MGVRVTKKELEALSAAAEYFEQEEMPLASSLRSLLNKYSDKAKETAEEGLAPGTIEKILIEESKGKVVPITGARDIFWIKQYQVWKKNAPTVEQVVAVGQWLGRQAWMQYTTVDNVSYKWPSFLARANAENRAQTKLTGRKEFTGE